MDIDSSSKPGLSAMMPLAAGLLGVLIGVIALFMALSNSSALTGIKSQLADMQSTTDSLKSVSGDVASLKQQMSTTNSKLDAVQPTIREWLGQMNTQFSGVITALNDKVDKLGTRSASTAPSAGTGRGATAPVTSAGGTYTVASGDSLIALAKKFNVTLAALQAANPGVVPEKLKPGQVLTIPATRPASSGSTSAPAPRGGPASAVSTS